MSAARSVAALSDIHGNLPALDAVLAKLRRDPPDAVVVGGDVAAGPMPREVLDRLRALPWPVHWLRGNADRAVVMGFDGTVPAELRDHPLFEGDASAARFLGRAGRDFLASPPPLVALEIEGLGEVLFCHATPRSGEQRRSAYWLRLGPDAELVRTPYDTAAADVSLHDLGYPAADLVLPDADPDEVAERYERASAKPVPAASLIARERSVG